MSVELKLFGGAYFPKDKALKKNRDLKPLAIAVNSTTKAVAEAVIFGKLAAEHPEWIEDYFKAKVWEHREGLPCPELDVFIPDFFGAEIEWDVNAGEPAYLPEEPENTERELDVPGLKLVSSLDKSSRTAALVLFGPVAEITPEQYGRMIDLINDEDGGFNRELAEAISRDSRVLALEPERQIQVLAWVRETAKETAQWTDIAKLLAKWLDTPFDKRPQATSTTSSQQRTETGATLGGGNVTDRGFVHGELVLDTEIILGLLAREREFDIYDIEPPLHQQIAEIRLSGTHEEFNAWHRIFFTTPGVLDFSRAINIAVVKTAPENIWKDQVKHREYFNRVMIESDHANPDPLIVDIACGRSSLPLPHQEPQNDETRPLSSGEANPPANAPLNDKEFEADIARAERERNAAEDQTGKQLAAGRGEFVPGISDPSDPKWVDGSAQPKIENLGGGVFSVDALMAQQPSNEVEKQEVPPALCDRDIEIAHALNDLISGRTNIMSKEEAEGVVTCTGHTITDVLPLLITDITTTEFCLSPDFDDDEIHNVATDILDNWSDDLNVRQKVALDGIVEYRRPIPPKSSAPVISTQPSIDAEPEQLSAPALTTLSYQQQLTIAALQGLCANPAYSAISDEIPDMARQMARAITVMESAE